MSSDAVCARSPRPRLISFAVVIAVAVVLWGAAPAWAILTGSPSGVAGRERFEVVPLGANSGAATFSSILSAPYTPADGKLYYELDGVGSGGFSGFPTLGAPSVIVSDTGMVPFSSSLTSSAGPSGAGPTAFGGGNITMGTGTNAVTFPAVGIADPGPNGFASVSVGFAQASWTNSTSVAGGAETLPVAVTFSEMVVVPVGALYEVGVAGRILYPGGPTYGVVAGIDNSGSRGPAFMNGGVSGDPNAPIFGSGAGFTSYAFNVTQVAPATFRIRGYGVFSTSPVLDGASVQLNATLTAAMDPGNGTFVRPGPYPTGAPVFGAMGVTINAAEDASFSTEWNNLAATHDFSSASNYTNGAPTATGEAFLADGPTTPDGKMISVTGSHSIHLITIANSTFPNYTLGFMPHEGSFSFGFSGGIEVYSGGGDAAPTINNCDVSSLGLLNFRVADPTTVLVQNGNVSSQQIIVDGLGKLIFTSPSVTFSLLQANLGTTEFTSSLTTSGGISIASGATVKLDAPSTLSAGGGVNVSAGGTLNVLSGVTTIGATVSNSGMIHVSPGAGVNFSGSLTNTLTGSLVVDGGAGGLVSMPFINSGTITNNGTLTFNNSYTGTHGIGGVGTTIFNGPLSTGTGSTAKLTIGGNAIINSDLFIRLVGPPSSTQNDVLSVNGHLGLGGTLHVTLGGGFAPALSDSFDVLDWGSASGHFSSVHVPTLAAGLAWNMTRLYSAGAISVVDIDHIPGDLDRNHVVDLADLSLLEQALTDIPQYQNNFGVSDADLLKIADVNNDGSFDNADLQADIDLLKLVYNTVADPAPLPGASVPEPAAIVLAAIGVLGLLQLRRP